MSGIWTFQNGSVNLLKGGSTTPSESCNQKKVLVDVDSGEVIGSYSVLKSKLVELGWENYNGDETDLVQFRKKSSTDIISIPKDFAKFTSIFMYDIVIKNPNVFEVTDA